MVQPDIKRVLTVSDIKQLWLETLPYYILTTGVVSPTPVTVTAPQTLLQLHILLLTIISRFFSPLRDILTDYWPHFNLSVEVKYHMARLGVWCFSTSSHPAVISFLDRDCRFKSVAMRIPHDACLARIRTAGAAT